MATFPIEFRGLPSGEAANLATHLCDAVGADVESQATVTELSVTLSSNATGRYRANFTTGPTGHHTLHVLWNTVLYVVADYILDGTTAVHLPNIAAGGPANLSTEGTNLSSD